MSERAVIFDLDGTLLDTLEDIARAANEALVLQGFPGHAPDAYRQFIGEGVSILFQKALPADARQPDTIARCVAGYQETYARTWHQRSTAYPGIPELLQQLLLRKVGLAVLSNKPHEFTVQCVQHFFPTIPFAAVLGHRPLVPKKPDPSGAYEAAQALGVSPRKCVYVGDSSIDMQTARAAGMYACGVAWGFRTVEELTEHGAQAILYQPSDLIPVIDAGG